MADNIFPPGKEDMVYEELCKLDKNQLDILKLAVDLSTRATVEKKEKRKFIHETIRIVVVAIVTAGLTLTANFILFSRNSADQLAKEEREEFRTLTSELRP